jgi:hypothetical protein
MMPENKPSEAKRLLSMQGV